MIEVLLTLALLSFANMGSVSVSASQLDTIGGGEVTIEKVATEVTWHCNKNTNSTTLVSEAVSSDVFDCHQG
ncbi:MAG: hypothetical protein COA99_05785 [Moraxellaceae bacterium]|nr:MAG: hypothetical protein COA99_05785 [Moraxellaceae bacterium]